MTNLLIFILTVYGISNILVYSSIFEGFRDFLTKFGTGPKSLSKLFSCMMCLPTWIGFIVSIIFNINNIPTPLSIFNPESMLLTTFLNGMIASGGVYAFNVLVEFFEGN